MQLLTTYLTMVVTMAALDFLWIGKIAKSIYRSGIGHLMADKPNLIAAAAFYLVFCAGLLWFAILPNPERTGMTKAITAAGIFGFCAYATYDLTNHATLKAWPISVTIVDMTWGTFASIVAVILGKTVFNKLAVH